MTDSAPPGDLSKMPLNTIQRLEGGRRVRGELRAEPPWFPSSSFCFATGKSAFAFCKTFLHSIRASLN